MELSPIVKKDGMYLDKSFGDIKKNCKLFLIDV